MHTPPSLSPYLVVPTAPPQDVTVINISSVSVVLQWKPPPQKQQNGRIRGYKVPSDWSSSSNPDGVAMFYSSFKVGSNFFSVRFELGNSFHVRFISHTLFTLIS